MSHGYAGYWNYNGYLVQPVYEFDSKSLSARDYFRSLEIVDFHGKVALSDSVGKLQKSRNLACKPRKSQHIELVEDADNTGFSSKPINYHLVAQ